MATVQFEEFQVQFGEYATSPLAKHVVLWDDMFGNQANVTINSKLNSISVALNGCR